MNPLISVIIPIYNKEPYLRECLDSVLSQSYKNIEVICVDDGSTDNSVSIVEEYIKKDKRVSLYKSKHAGPSSARNIGIDKCKGDYIHFMDADDLIKPNCYEFIFSKLLLLDKNIDMIYFYHYIFDNFDNFNVNLNKIRFFIDYCGDVEYRLLSLKKDSDFLLSYKSGGPCISNKILKRDIIIKYNVKFDIDSCCEDNMFFYEYAKYVDYCICFPFDFYCYRKNIPCQHSFQKQNKVSLEKLGLNTFNKLKHDYKMLGGNIYLSFCNSILDCIFNEYKNISSFNQRFLGINDLKEFIDKNKNDFVFASALKNHFYDFDLLNFNEQCTCSNINFQRKYEEEKRKYEEEKRKYEEEKRKYEEEKRRKENLLKSETFKIGKIVIYPFRLIKRIFKR